MFITAKLAFENYIPEQPTKSMWFKQRVKDVIYGKIYQYDRIFEMTTLGQLSPEDFDSFVQMNGYPVRPKIMSYTANPDEPAVVLATHEQIGWWDEDPSSDEMRDIELKDINMILSDFDGEIEIQVEDGYLTTEVGDEEEVIVPVLYMDKVTLSVPGTHDEYPDDYEDMDWEDDEPEEDGAGFTEADRQPRSHFVSNEEADEDYRSTLKQDEQRYADKHKGDKCLKYDSDHDTE